MPIIVRPGIAPILVNQATSNPSGSSKVKFVIFLPTVEVPVIFLITLCIKIKIGGLTVYIYFSKTVTLDASGPASTELDALLPNGSEILESSATFDALYPEVG